MNKSDLQDFKAGIKRIAQTAKAINTALNTPPTLSTHTVPIMLDDMESEIKELKELITPKGSK